MDTLKQLLTSKKALVALATVASYALARFGLDVPLDDLIPIVTVGTGYLVGQGIADHGKGRTLAEAAKDGPFKTTPTVRLKK